MNYLRNLFYSSRKKNNEIKKTDNEIEKPDNKIQKIEKTNNKIQNIETQETDNNVQPINNTVCRACWSPTDCYASCKCNDCKESDYVGIKTPLDKVFYKAKYASNSEELDSAYIEYHKININNRYDYHVHEMDNCGWCGGYDGCLIGCSCPTCKRYDRHSQPCGCDICQEEIRESEQVEYIQRDFNRLKQTRSYLKYEYDLAKRDIERAQEKMKRCKRKLDEFDC